MVPNENDDNSESEHSTNSENDEEFDAQYTFSKKAVSVELSGIL